ncbi:TPA: hypothetical protein QFI06_000759 [Enterococcus faecium]
MYSDIKIVKGNGGYGGPLIIRPTKKLNTSSSMSQVEVRGQ